MKNNTMRMGVAVAGAVLVPLVGFGTPANAACGNSVHFTSTSYGNSQKFDARSDCDGVYGINTDTYADSVRGRYYKDGAWQVSSLGWQPLYPASQGSSKEKIVGNTTDGRDIKGQSNNYNQLIKYRY